MTLIGEEMAKLRRIVLDVLKPRQPNILEFAKAIAGLGADYRVQVLVDEVDDKTESVMVEIEGEDIDFSAVESVINDLGGSLHSIDEVEARGAEAEVDSASPQAS